MQRDQPTRLSRVAGPIALANLVQISVVTTDSVLLGRVDTVSLAAAALAFPVYLVALIVLRSWSTAVQIVAARQHGAHRRDALASTLIVGVLVSLVGGAVLATALTVLRGPIIELLAADDTAADVGRRYLTVLVWALPLAGCILSVQAFDNAVGRPRHTLYANVVLAVTNLATGIALVFGLGLGVVGAGTATIVSSAVALIYLLTRRRPTLIGLAVTPGLGDARRLSTRSAGWRGRRPPSSASVTPTRSWS